MTLDVEGMGFHGPANVAEYRFDQEHNSPFRVARSLRDRPSAMGAADPNLLAEVMRSLEGSDREARREALAKVHKLDTAGRQAVLPTILKLAAAEQDPGIRSLASDGLKTLFAPTAYSRARSSRFRRCASAVR